MARNTIPPVVAVIATLWLGESDLAAAAAAAAALALPMAFAAGLLKNFRYPHRLMPFSRFFVAALPTFAGALVAGLLALSGANGLVGEHLLAAAGLALASALIVEVVTTRLLSARPLRVAVLGSPSFAAGLKREIAAGGATEPIEVVGWLNLGSDFDLAPDDARARTIESIRAAISEHEIDLLVRGPERSDGRVNRASYNGIVMGCVDLPVRLIDGNQFYEQMFGHVPLGTIGTDWFNYIMHPSFEATPPVAKRVFDVAGALVAGVVALPLIAIGALAVKLGDGGSVFYRQRRVGEGGREYDILKLRTMTEDAEVQGAQWSTAGDARITAVGKVLRRTHVDELPQIINVLRGEMTLVGPRPERPEIITELEQLFPHYRRRLLVKPGVTGWAQVRCGYAGSELGTAWKLCHDLFYLKHRSMLGDALIMVETLVIAAKDSHREMHSPQAEFLFDSDQVAGVATFQRPAEAPVAKPAADADTVGVESGQVPEITMADAVPGATSLRGTSPAG